MITMRVIRLVGLVLGSSLVSLTGAQESNRAAPPPLNPPTQHQQQPSTSAPQIEFYSRPSRSAVPQADTYTQQPAYQSPPDPVTDQRDVASASAGGSMRIQESQGIRYVSGGIGLEERDELESLSDQFNLRLLFAVEGDGKYLADVQVTILDTAGQTILSAISEGPWFFAQLPSGKFTVEVSAFEQTQKRAVQTSEHQSRLNFYWR